MTQKVDKGVKKGFNNLLRNLRGFSLVELIIVIAIIAILSVAGFLTLQKWISQSRDSKRLGDLETVEKSLTINYTDQDTEELYPMPDENNDGSSVTTGEIDGETVAYKGTFGSGAIENVDNLNEVPVDPLDDNRYAYGVTEDQQYFQVAAVLENGEKVSLNLTNRAYAADKKSVVRGNYGGLMVYTSGSSNYISNIPSLIFNNTGSLTNTGVVSYVVDGSSNLAYGEDTTQKESFEEVVRKTYGLSGGASVSFVNTGVNNLKDAIENDALGETTKNSLGGNEGVIEAKLEESGVRVSSYDGGSIDVSKDCEEILNNNSGASSGVYKIDPDGEGGVDAFDVYCNMTTDGGGWTHVATIDGNDEDNWSENKSIWQDDTTLGSFSSKWSSDYKNKAYAKLTNVSNIMIAWNSSTPDSDTMPSKVWTTGNEISSWSSGGSLVGVFINACAGGCKSNLNSSYGNDSQDAARKTTQLSDNSSSDINSYISSGNTSSMHLVIMPSNTGGCEESYSFLNIGTDQDAMNDLDEYGTYGQYDNMDTCTNDPLVARDYGRDNHNSDAQLAGKQTNIRFFVR